MTIYHMPLYKKLHEIAVSGELGPLRMIQMNFGSYKAVSYTHLAIAPNATWESPSPINEKRFRTSVTPSSEEHIAISTPTIIAVSYTHLKMTVLQ